MNGLIAWFAATLISRHLVKNIRFAVSRVRKITEDKSSTARVGLNDGTEISYLTKEFDRLLDTLEVSQQQAVSAKIMTSRIELAKVIAHNIKSPVVALDMMLPLLTNIPEKTRKVLRAAVDEIKSLSIDLKKASAGEMISPVQFKFEEFGVKELVSDLVNQKRYEFETIGVACVELIETEFSEISVHGCPSAIRGVLSNVINNAIESYAGAHGRVLVKVSQKHDQCEIAVEDFGSGIEQGILELLGEKSFSTKTGIGRGIGIVHARSAVEANGGKIQFRSAVGRGTTVTLSLPVSV